MTPDVNHEGRVHPPGFAWMELPMIGYAEDDVSVEFVLSVIDETLGTRLEFSTTFHPATT